MRRRAAALALVVAAAGLGVAGGSRGVQAAPAAARPAVTVTMGEFFFRPRKLTVHVGQAVRFVNVGKIVHTVADTDARGNVRSKLIKPRPLAHGEVQVVRFTKPGTVPYLCTFHPSL